jgi:predicted ATPase/class 3 adenylate cyclase
MKCPKCQRENPEDAIFCNGCGQKLELACPECGKLNPPDSKFCNKCGHNLTLPSEPTHKDISFDEKLEKIQRYLPKGLTEKILSQRDRIEGERKQVTVLFCDMEGFTSLSERLGPEEAYTVMDQVYEILIHQVHDYEGTVNEFTGDGVMALFGAPIALEDAPQRAIRSAHAIHREMTKFSDKVKQETEIIHPLIMRIGIHSGPVVVGTLGNDLRVEFKAVGDTVNLASRMEGLAEPGSTYVTEDTFRLTEGLFRFEALGEYEVKGKEGIVKAYRVIAPSTRRTRFDVSAERGLTPFVGRGRELELLLDGFERSKSGRGQAFSIVAEAGVGKSRLLYEFRKAVANEDVTFLEGKCLSYSKGVVYHSVIDIVKSNYHIMEGDNDFEIKEKVKQGLKILGVDEAATLPYLLELLSVNGSDVHLKNMSPEARKDRIIETLNRIAIKASQIRPLIMAIEDLHWIDKNSEDRFKSLLDAISGARIFLIFTYRPEFVHTWGAKSYHSQVNLNRLSNRESLAMVAHLLETENIDSTFEEMILEKSEGVPFFVEEFIKSLKDLKIIEKKDGAYHLEKNIQAVSIPSTIQDVIMARVDSLPEVVKEVLQIGSVIEREFSYELIKEISELSEKELLSRLSVLKDSELLFERGIYPESTYIFKHALTQEVIYDSILIRKKKKLHDQIGLTIERLYKDNIHEYYGILAQHFIYSENYEKGAEYSKLAARKSQKASAFKNAIEHAKQRAWCLERLPQSEVIQRQIIDARILIAGYGMNIGHYAEIKEVVAPIVDLAQELNYQKRLPMIYAAIGSYSFMIEEDKQKGFQYFNEALKIAEETEDYPSIYFANLHLGHASHLFNCEFEKSLEFFKRCLNFLAQTNNPVGFMMISTLMNLNYAHNGKTGLALQLSRELLQKAEDNDDIFIKGGGYISHGFSCYCKGWFDEAENNFLKGTTFNEKTDHGTMAASGSGILGNVYCELGKYKTAQDYFKKAISILEHLSVKPSEINLYKIAFAKAKVLNSDIDVNLRELYARYRIIKHEAYKGQAARDIGMVLLYLDNQAISDAEDWIKKAIETDKKNNMPLSLASDCALYAELLKRKEDLSKARENLNTAIEICQECGADGWVERYEKELAAL